MATNFPTSLDTATQQPSPSASDAMDATGKEHATVHTNHSGALLALEAKAGTGASTPTANAVFMGTGTGSSAWDTSPTFKGDVTVGYDDYGHDVKFYGDTANKCLLWDASGDALIVKDTVDAVNFKVDGAQGSDGQVLTSTGSGVAWEDAGGGGGGGLPTGMSFSNTAGLVLEPNDIGSNISGSYPYGNLILKSQSSLGNYQGTNMSIVGADGTTIVGTVGYEGSKVFRLKNHQSGWMYIQTGGSAIVLGDLAYIYSNRMQPQQNNVMDIGTSSLLFQDMYSVGGVTTSSDVNLKEDIKDTTLGLDFINDLRPVEYKWKDGTRKHQGFIAQEVKAVLDDKDSSTDQGMWGLNTVKDPKTTLIHWDENDPKADHTEEVIDTVPKQSLRYHELIAPLVKAVQELTTQNEALTARIATLEG